MSEDEAKPVTRRRRVSVKPVKKARKFLAVNGDLVDPISGKRFPVAGMPVEIEDIREGSWVDCQIKAGLLKEYI